MLRKNEFFISFDDYIKQYKESGKMFNLNRKIEIKNPNSNFSKNNCLHVAYGTDEKFFLGMETSMLSIALNNHDMYFFFHIITNDITDLYLNKLKKLINNYMNFEIKIYCVSVEILRDLPTNIKWSQAIYYRIFIPEIVDAKIERVLYLDSDTLCINDLREIKSLEMKNKVAMVVEDLFVTEKLEEKVKKIPLVEKKYFNSGVMYIDIYSWKQSKLTQCALSLLAEDMNRYEYWDQDVLNVLLNGKVLFGKEKWNYLYNLYSMIQEPPRDTIFIHFITENKPWKLWTMHHFLVDIYNKYKKESTWENQALELPKNFKEMHRTAKTYLVKKNYRQAVFWYLRYIRGKFCAWIGETK